MRRALGRRSLFFAFLAVVCVALVPVTPTEFRWVAWFGAAVGTFWAVLIGIEDFTRPMAERRERAEAEMEMPFAPPPPPGR
jgi:hypothetical protein